MKVLVTAAGCPGWYSIVQAMELWDSPEPLEVVGSEIDSDQPRSGHLVFRVCRGDSPLYYENIMNLVKQGDIEMILPLSDPELIPLAHMSDDLFALGCEPLCSPGWSLAIALDREQLWGRFPKLAPSYTIVDRANAGSFSTEMLEGKFVRLRTGYGSRGVKKLVSKQTLLDAFGTAKPEAFGGMISTDLFPDLIMAHGSLMLVDELPGAEYSVDCVFSFDGHLVGYGVRERTVIRNGICQKATFIPDARGEFRDIIDQIAEKLRFRYCINLQLRRDVYGVLRLLEINPRTPGSIGAWLPAGINPMAMVMDLATDHSPTSGEFTPNPAMPTTTRVSTFV